MSYLCIIFRKSVLILVVLFGLVGISTQLNDFEIAKNLEIFSNIYRELNSYYVDDLDPEYLMETGANAMLKSLDPYTTYIPADEVAQFKSSITGKYGGVGASIVQGKNHVLISLPYEGGPAQLAGLKAGDKMLEIDGVSVKGSTVRQVSNKMRGSSNSTVQVKVERINTKNPLEFSMKRQEIKISNTPYFDILDESIAYIVLSSFTENAGKNVAKALQTLKAQKDLKGVVLDLRGNSGGLLTEAVNVANVFLKKGAKVVQIKGREKERQQLFRTLNQPIDSEIPVCVLIDNNSASAAEIVAGALQDLDRGVIIGQRSFGKGLVQNTRDLSFGAKVKLTTARYYIPSGRCIQSLQYKNGKAINIPDSLKSPFFTASGRKVFDGGGVNPDVLIENESFLTILKDLRKELYLFDFASIYASKHPTIVSASSFRLTDQDFKDFLNFLEEKGYRYQTETEKILDALQKQSSKESFAQTIQPALDQIKQKLKESSKDALMVYKDSFLYVLQRFIAGRYHYRKGAYQAGIAFDDELERAVTMLTGLQNYQQILQSPR